MTCRCCRLKASGSRKSSWTFEIDDAFGEESCMAKETYRGPLEQVDTCCWRIPKSYKQGMRVDGLILTNEALLAQLQKDQAPEQVANVAFLPGIQHASLATPD